MAGESDISTKGIEQRAADLEVKLGEEQVAVEKAETERVAAEAAKNTPAPVKKDVSETKPLPNDPVELRKWNTRVSMELSDLKKQIAALGETLNRNSKKPVDYVALAKDPEKLKAAIETREKELITEHQTKSQEQFNEATARITNYEDKIRFTDSVNYPRWAELKPLMLKLSAPNESQPNGDPRINFNQDPKVVLDDLYELAQEVASADPNYKKEAPRPAGKSFTQEEYDAAILKAKDEATSEATAALKNEARGAGVGSMGKGSTKSQPGKVDKTVLWNMPLGDLKSALQKASE